MGAPHAADFLRLLALVLLGVLAMLPSPVHGQATRPAFALIQIPAPASEISIAADINNAGQVIGNFQSGSSRRAFLWSRRSGLVMLPRPGADASEWYASGINDCGEIAGFARDATGVNNYPVVWTVSGGVVTITRLAERHPELASVSSILDINDQGHLIGDLAESSTGNAHAYLWTPQDGVTDLGTLGGSYSFAYGLNGRDEVVGTSSLVGDGEWQAYLWTRATGMQRISIAGTDRSEAFGINNSTEVAGQFGALTLFNPTHAFRWTTESGMVDLRPDQPNNQLHFTSSWARGINEQGEIVGTASFAGIHHAFLWTSQNGLIDLTPGSANQFSAERINRYGDIIGSLTPASSSAGLPRVVVWEKPPISKYRDFTPPEICRTRGIVR